MGGGFRMTIRGWMTRGEASVLHAYESTISVVIWDLKPGGAVAVCPGGEFTPADDGWVKLALLEEEGAGGNV